MADQQCTNKQLCHANNEVFTSNTATTCVHRRWECRLSTGQLPNTSVGQWNASVLVAALKQYNWNAQLLLLLFISHKNAAQKNTHHINTAYK